MGAKIIPFRGHTPQIGKNVYLGEGVVIIGDVTIGDGASIWPNVVIRGDINHIGVGKYTNIQDGTMVHIMEPHPTIIGDYCTIGHGAVIHCNSVGDNCVIGMGAVLLGYAEIGENSIVGGGTTITQHKVIPAGSMVYGNPFKIVRPLTEEEIERNRHSAMHYHDLAMEYLNEGYDQQRRTNQWLTSKL